MTAIHVVAILMLLIIGFSYKEISKLRIAEVAVKGKKNKQSRNVSKGEAKLDLVILLVVAGIIRIIASTYYIGHETDMNCFQVWADMVYSGGISNFYKSDAFTDYPPGYMYVLYVIGFLKSVLHTTYNSSMAVFLTKLPAMACDLITTWLIYQIARKKFNEKGALLISAVYVLNPLILLNSSVWGQVDAVFTLFVVWMCYLVTEKKLIAAYFVFAAGILMKPQTMIFTPILIYGIVDQVILDKFSWKRFFKHLGLGLLAIASMFVVVAPFGISYVVKQYTETLASYPYASTNAYNFWGMLGLSWASQDGVLLGLTYKTWGTVSIVLAVLATAVLNFKQKNSKSKYYFLGALLVSWMFCFSVRMHERYVFPAIALLLIAYCVRPRKELFMLYTGLSVVNFYNCAHALFFYDYQNFNAKAPVIILTSMAAVFVTVCLIYFAYKMYWCEKEENEKTTVVVKKKDASPVKGNTNPITASRKLEKMTKKDWIIVSIITVVYGCIAFTNLGDMEAPESEFSLQTGESFTIDLGENEIVNKIAWFNGREPYGKVTIETSLDNVTFTPLVAADAPMEMNGVFCWHEKDLVSEARYYRFTVTENTAFFRELLFLDSKGQALEVSEVQTTAVDEKNAKNMFDEEGLYPEEITYMNGTYFDEIYHPRTAYEMVHGLYNYEWTHPPLGKFIMSIGIRIFGMVPFGWRFMGTLFGVLMVPIMYIFGKKFFGKTWIASVLALIFTFDFMHYVQTRLATIDVFVTFFIILMYYFMYLYTQKSFYDTKLWKTFVPLGLSGIMMGFGVASKWTGAYAGVGLAIIFFATIIKRYREYLYAKQNPTGSTNGISHEFIVKSFSAKTMNTLAFCVVFFVMVPGLIYLLSYIPFEDNSGNGLIKQMLDNQKAMFDYHAYLEAEHPYSSKWYQWPIMYRPIWYYSGSPADASLGAGISGFGNPLVWWLGIPAFIYMLYLVIQKKDGKAAFLSVAYLAQFAPWFLVDRVIFIYHYFPSVPFVALMVAYGLYAFAKENTKRQKVVFGYVVAVIILFIMFYPVLTGTPVSKEYVSTWLRWFDSWVLVSGA